jgi:hypothetical protein
MQDLFVINARNRATLGPAVEQARAAGNYVVTRNDGLHVVGYHTFASREGAVAHRDALVPDATPSEHFSILEPYNEGQAAAVAAVARGRDQSEDYAS